MAEENSDIFGNEIPADDEDDDLVDDPDIEDSVPDDDSESDEEGEQTEDVLQAEGEEPQDLETARKYWQAAYTKSRQKDREKYGEIEQQHQQYQELLANFYQDDNYAMQVIRQRFPNLANQLSGQPGQAAAPQGGQSSGVTEQLQQSLGEFGFLADSLGPAIERIIDARVSEKVGPIEQRTKQQTEQQRKAEKDKLLAEMDGKYPGWDEKYRTQMDEMGAFLQSDHLVHPKFGSKYELIFRLANPDAARSDAIREMGSASRRRSGLSRGGRGSVPNISEQVRKAESNADAFRLASRAAAEETG